MKHKEEYLEYYISRGMKIFPCICNGKSPVISGWQEKATTDMETINNWWNNYKSSLRNEIKGKFNV